MSFATVALRAAKKPAGSRAFHTPFALLGTSPLTASTSAPPNELAYQYEKQYYDLPHEPLMSSSGYRTYVVSEPDASSRHYEVPAGAYPTSSPFLHHFGTTAAPEVGSAQYSSTSPNLLAHGFTTRAAPQHPGGVGESSAVRFKAAPGEMGARGGGYGGAGLVDAKGTKAGVGSLGERNPQPDSKVAEQYSKAGVDSAWKLRK
ncbi:hypothetical protein JR316_0006014 [Psilocybe cubensis]|uniref:Uncharacterized protein n=2 Tax=Psilocybe cubensis TaxID=181762 RepID=A0A8H7Y2G4_PSICU|nr:hypothetical protein JR316_0006014 [Psilocybe cubensis]KAH9481487.1 hypothetical protein JR316_0006014 [Psilocybe cubensis]